MKRIGFLLAFIVLFGLICTPVKAELHTGFETGAMSGKEKRENQYHYEIRVYHEPQKGMTLLKNIAVNRDGTKIAIGFSNGTVEIYDPNGNFQIGYKLNNPGVFGLEFDAQDDGLCISLIRSDSIFKIDSRGKLLYSAWIKKTPENMNYFSELNQQSWVTSGNTSYELRGVQSTLIYDQCVKTGPVVSKVIYDRQVQYKKFGICAAAVILILAAGFVFYLVKMNGFYKLGMALKRVDVHSIKCRFLRLHFIRVFCMIVAAFLWIGLYTAIMPHYDRLNSAFMWCEFWIWAFLDAAVVFKLKGDLFNPREDNSLAYYFQKGWYYSDFVFGIPLFFITVILLIKDGLGIPA